MEYKKKSKNLKNKIILGLAFVLFITTFIYTGFIDSVWDGYNAIDSFAGNRAQFDQIAEIILNNSKQTKCVYYYIIDDYEIYATLEDSKGTSEVKVPLSENDMYSLKKVKELLSYEVDLIIVKDYGIEFCRDEKSCNIIYIYKDIYVNDINSDFIEDNSDYLAFEKIEGNWYNVLRKSCF